MIPYESIIENERKGRYMCGYIRRPEEVEGIYVGDCSLTGAKCTQGLRLEKLCECKIIKIFTKPRELK